jgi:hypothetical protein
VIRIEKRNYRGWPNSYFFANGSVELVVLADVRPRVVRYAFTGGENQFHEFENQSGLCGGGEFRLYGGHRLWVWPEVERTYFPDNRSVEVKTTAAGATFTDVRLIHSITNHSSAPMQLAPWTPTVMRPGGRGILPFPLQWIRIIFSPSLH